MENGSKLVSDAILGTDLKYVTVGGRVYALKPPSIKVILMAIRHLSKVRVGSELTKLTIMAEYERNTKHIARALAVLVSHKDGWRSRRMAKQFYDGTYEELLAAFQVLVGMMGGDAFFGLAQLAKSLNQIAAKPK